MAGVGAGWARRPGTWAGARSSPGPLARLGGWLEQRLEGGAANVAGTGGLTSVHLRNQLKMTRVMGGGCDWLRSKPRVTPHAPHAPPCSLATRGGGSLHVRMGRDGLSRALPSTTMRALHAAPPIPAAATGATATAEADEFLAKLDAARPGIFLGLVRSD